MIVYGRRSTTLLNKIIPEKCPACESSNTLQLNIFQNYAHIFWIPVFPMGKVIATVCTNCQQVLQEDAMPNALKEKSAAEKVHTRIPIWTFVGSALILALIVGISISSAEDSKNTNIFVQSPKAGDVYEVKTAAGEFSLLKIIAIKQDTVLFLANQYVVDRQSGLSKIKDKGNDAYATDTFALLKNTLPAMLVKGDILNVERE